MTRLEKWLLFLKEHEQEFRQLIGERFRLLVVDPDLTVVCFRDYDSEIDIDLSEGKKMPENSSSAIAMREKKIVRRIVPKEVFGTEVQTITVPFEDGSGCINIALNISTAVSVTNALDQIVAATEEIASASQLSKDKTVSVEEKFSDLTKSISMMAEETKKLLQIHQMVKKIAKDLALISLNALIEAAHAGEYGRGFSVVATEVRKLADQTAQQMEDVSAIIDKITEYEQRVSKEVETFREFSQEQHEIARGIAEAIQHVTASTQALQVETKRLLQLDE